MGCRQWRSLGFEASVAVRLPAPWLADPAVAGRITGTVRACGVEPRHVVLEFPGAGVLAGEAIENLARLRLKGFGLGVLDSGSAGVALRELRAVPFTELTLASEYVRAATSQRAGRLLLQATLQIARDCGLTVVAAGVESAGAWGLLRELGCPLAQGGYISPAMPLPQALAWLQHREHG